MPFWSGASKVSAVKQFPLITSLLPTAFRRIGSTRKESDISGSIKGIPITAGRRRQGGCLLATSEQYDAVALLDADNGSPDHIERCLEAARSVKGGYCDYVIARIRMVRPDGSIMNLPAEPVSRHVDTSCYVFLRGSFHMLPIWGLMPKERIESRGSLFPTCA